MFKELPHEYVSPLDLQNVVETGGRYYIRHFGTFVPQNFGWVGTFLIEEDHQ